MDVRPFEPRGTGRRLQLARPEPQSAAAGAVVEMVGMAGVAERLLGAVLQATGGAASPVMMTVSVQGPLRAGGCEADARLTHADGRQQRWLAALRQAGAVVARAHVVLDGELPSSSYIPWRSGLLPATAERDDSMARYLAVARICDAPSSPCAAAAAAPLWITVRYFVAPPLPAGAPAPLTLSSARLRGLGGLREWTADVLEGHDRIAALTLVLEGAHGEA